ncbi:MAG: hypothetical protein A3I66_06565 [Burkholderiales bacterium RIFCSPLOWO2_02_FULL_57_36]|nr:MAG: hypothetical protein A3I66_06565 [Burkholderiales bacterium RIFCSPLOWO2_02_FULL_57_36]
MGGSLRKNGRLRSIAQAILLRMTSLPARGLRKIGISRAEAARIDLDSIRIPDTTAARDAFELCTEASVPFLINHCVRTYLWGALLAANDRLQYDEELFYVASLLHDLGLTDTCRRNGKCNCFAEEGAQAALQFAQGHQWPEPRQQALTNAIYLHLNNQVTIREGMEAHLLHAGASLDVIGARYGEIHAQDRIKVLDQFPRVGFKARMIDLMKNEAETRPESRAGYLVGIGLNRMIRAAPFAD